MTLLVDNGGMNLCEFVKRNMKFLLDSDLVRQLNLTGQKDKKAFKDPKMFDVLFVKLTHLCVSIHC